MPVIKESLLLKHTAKLVPLLFVLASSLPFEFAMAETATEPKDRFVEVLGLRLQYLDWGGTGEGLLFVPGGCDTAYVFGDIAPAFTDRFHVVSFTPRGCGQSDHPASGYELDTLLKEMAGFLDAVGIQKATLAGHSSGGGKITRFARLYGSRVSRLVYFDTVYSYVAPDLEGKIDSAIVDRIGGSPRTSFDLMRRSETLWELGSWSEARQRNLREIFTETDSGLKSVTPPAWLKAFDADMVAGRYFETGVAHPALMIFSKNLDQERVNQFSQATRDALASSVAETAESRSKQMKEFQANGPHIKVVEMEGTGPYCFVHKPREVIRLMREFLVRSTR
ncbi:MAG: alpha/beta hydrolase [Acidobacteriota bacterium]